MGKAPLIKFRFVVGKSHTRTVVVEARSLAEAFDKARTKLDEEARVLYGLTTPTAWDLSLVSRVPK